MSNEQFIAACECGSMAQLQTVLDNPKRTITMWNRGICVACIYEHYDVARFLIAHCDAAGIANFNWNWIAASAHMCAEFVTYVFDRARAEGYRMDWNNALKHACNNGYHDLITRIMAHAADDEYVLDLAAGLCTAHIDVVERMLPLYTLPIPERALVHACQYGCMEILTMLLARNPPNINISYYIECAITHRHSAIAEMLCHRARHIRQKLNWNHLLICASRNRLYDTVRFIHNHTTQLGYHVDWTLAIDSARRCMDIKMFKLIIECYPKWDAIVFALSRILNYLQASQIYEAMEVLDLCLESGYTQTCSLTQVQIKVLLSVTKQSPARIAAVWPMYAAYIAELERERAERYVILQTIYPTVLAAIIASYT
jgi:hypothetical protein